MEIVNRTRIDDANGKDVAQLSSVAGECFVVFLDDAVNAVLADFARGKLQESRQKGWEFTRQDWKRRDRRKRHPCLHLASHHLRSTTSPIRHRGDRNI